MALFGIFKKDNDKKGTRKGFHQLEVAAVKKLTEDSVKIELNVPQDLKGKYIFKAGQYLDFSIDIDGKEEHRSYSICSGAEENLSIAVKSISNGKVSKWFNGAVKSGDAIWVSEPRGNFTLKESDKNVTAIAAGSGITPILSIAKELKQKGGMLNLVYGNRKINSIIFKDEIAALDNVKVDHYLTGEKVEGYHEGRINKDSFTEWIKADLNRLKSDAFFICGPEQLIMDVKATLTFFGVSNDKIRYELFTTPVLMESSSKKVVSTFEGVSKVKAVLESEVAEFSLATKGGTLLEAAEKAGLDAPYSCKGGVCCSCRAKVLKGSAMMKANYALTDEEVEQGYILTCQAHPTSEELIFSFDE